VPAALVRDALEIAYRFARSGERGGAVDPTLLLSSRDEGARAVGAVFLGADAAAGAREVRRLAGAPPSVSLAFAVALARRTGTTPAAPPLLARREEAAAVASLLARSARSELLGRGFVEAAEYAGARGDSMLLRML